MADKKTDIDIVVVEVPCDNAPDGYVHKDTCRNHPKNKGGPAMVNSDAYRDRWTDIFGNKQERGQA